ncbi:hypothetical protein H8E07_15500 [bacterium]|nr:hypothetical protein [bacterium]
MFNNFCCRPTDLNGASGVHVYIEMDDGNDIVCLSDHAGPAGCAAVAATAVYWDGTSEIYGQGDDDQIETSAEGGTAIADEVYGGEGDDTIYTFNGADDAYGDGGYDTIRGVDSLVGVQVGVDGADNVLKGRIV